jgi:hypothetical protein
MAKKTSTTNSSSGGTIIASVFITLLIAGAGIYFGLPYLFPAIKTTSPVVQIKYQEYQTMCFIWDNEMAQKPMNDTSLVISTQGNTRLSIEFSTRLMYGVDSTFDTVSTYDFISYNITMVVDGVQNFSLTVEFGELKDGQWGTIPFFMHVITPILSAGSYNITMYWFSRVDATGNNWLSANHYPNNRNNARLLYIEEILP